MNKHITTPWLERYHDGELRGYRLRQVEKHLTRCIDCRKELDQLQKLRTLLLQSTTPNPRIPHEQFVAQVGLRLPRRQYQPIRHSVLPVIWVLVPLSLLGLWIFVQTVLMVSAVISNVISLGLGPDVTELLPPSGQNDWLLNISSSSNPGLNSLIDALFQWFESGGPLGWAVTLNYILLVVIGLLYWSWLTGWRIYRQHHQKTNGFEPSIQERKGE